VIPMAGHEDAATPESTINRIQDGRVLRREWRPLFLEHVLVAVPLARVVPMAPVLILACYLLSKSLDDGRI
jgi:hypothetical protein